MAFATTRWTLVLRARDRSGGALGELIGAYWKPVYFYIRHWGATADRASDLTQGYFAELIERDTLAAVDPERGRFRTYVIATLRNYLVNQAAHDRAQKRGGGAVALALDTSAAESDLAAIPDPGPALDTAFDRQWALAVLARALDALAAEHAPDRALAIRRHFAAESVPSYDDTAASLGVSVPAVKSLLHRARLRFADLVRAEVRDQVGTAEHVADELRHLLSLL